MPLKTMKFNENYRLYFELDDIFIQKKDDAGRWQDYCSISETAAMAWEGLERNIEHKALVEAICNEFSGATAEQVEADLAGLTAQLKQMGILLDD